ncbi:unnamed protein product [Schistocephalus solidus]|uniref:tRNA-synt_2 domain-containing protein n=1 Tax=Schistocephalus solidus TaxID=70667 RepID=A0A183TL38_SCHSO|nr:unnamed protein product [Schistocephalus solidus]
MPLATVKALSEMLRPYHPEVLKDPRTLLRIPRTDINKVLKNGRYVHMGLGRGSLDELNLRRATEIPEMGIQLHVDVMKFFKDLENAFGLFLLGSSHDDSDSEISSADEKTSWTSDISDAAANNSSSTPTIEEEPTV